MSNKNFFILILLAATILNCIALYDSLQFNELFWIVIHSIFIGGNVTAAILCFFRLKK